jgi:hypothetical protein
MLTVVHHVLANTALVTQRLKTKPSLLLFHDFLITTFKDFHYSIPLHTVPQNITTSCPITGPENGLSLAVLIT